MRSDCFFFYTTCHFLADNSLQSADKDQQESRAVAEKPHDAVVKFDNVSKFIAASRGPHGDSTASCCILPCEHKLQCCHDVAV